MSRHIQTVNPETRKLNNQTTKGKLILTHIQERAVAFLLCDNILTWAQVLSKGNDDRVGQIYIGKVKNIVSNINACFVEIANGEICYLSLKDAKNAYILNRPSAETARNNGEVPTLIAGDELPVQIIRNAIKTKPAAVSCAIELQNDYFVCKADIPALCVSSKINKEKGKQILGALEQKKSIPPFCVIARTMCQELNEADLLMEYNKISDAFINLYKQAKFRTCFSCIHSDSSPAKSILRQIPSYEFEEIITDIPEIYEELNDDPSLTRSIRYYDDTSISLLNLYGLQSKFDTACSQRVWMKSGANLIIEQTECLTAIDVNSSKNIKGKLSEDVIFQINKEAAAEAAVQIRLRNLSGIIIIDFINMKDKEREGELLAYLKSLTAKDPVTTRVVDMTPLGLVEITRKKIYPSLKEQLYHEIR